MEAMQGFVLTLLPCGILSVTFQFSKINHVHHSQVKCLKPFSNVLSGPQKDNRTLYCSFFNVVSPKLI